MKAFAWIMCLMLLVGCRTIEGTYYESFGAPGGGATYQFRRDGSFQYESKYDVGAMRGNGHYKIRFGRIKFFFEKPIEPPVPTQDYALINRDSTDNSNRFTVIVKDEMGFELPGAVVQLISDSTSIHGATDLDGVVKFMIGESMDSVTVRIKFIGFYEPVIRTSVKHNSELRVQLKLWYSFGYVVDSGTVWNYRIRQVRNDTMILRKTERHYEFDDDYKRRLRWKRHRIVLGKRD